MSESKSKGTKPVKVGVKVGGGPPPGFIWNVSFFGIALDEADQILTSDQKEHAKDLVRELAREEHPTHPRSVSVDQVEDFYEIRDKGGILGKINLRIFFSIEVDYKTILILAVVKKEADGQTPTWMKVRVRNRLRRFRKGDFRSLT
jgi:hypothetical protein